MIEVTSCYVVSAAKHYITPMLEAHFREVGNTAVYALAPDWDKYQQIADNGGLTIALAWDGDYCIGYSASFVTPHPHYVNQKVCYNDVLFVAKEYRNGSAGARLMAKTRELAKVAGCVVMQWHAKPDTALDAVLRKRANLFEHVYTQAL